MQDFYALVLGTTKKNMLQLKGIKNSELWAFLIRIKFPIFKCDLDYVFRKKASFECSEMKLSF